MVVVERTTGGLLTFLLLSVLAGCSVKYDQMSITWESGAPVLAYCGEPGTLTRLAIRAVDADGYTESPALLAGTVSSDGREQVLSPGDEYNLTELAALIGEPSASVPGSLRALYVYFEVALADDPEVTIPYYDTIKLEQGTLSDLEGEWLWMNGTISADKCGMPGASR